jgi:hypothetical protein
MGAQDRLALVQFDHECEVLCTLTPVSQSNTMTLLQAIAQLKARGFTNFREALSTAFNLLNTAAPPPISAPFDEKNIHTENLDENQSA